MMKKIVIAVVCALFAYCFGAATVTANQHDDNSLSKSSPEMKALEWGFKFASAIPVKPHAVDRSKSQYSVLSIYIEKEMLERALELSRQIEDWRQCLFYADMACYYAQKDPSNEEIQRYLERADTCLRDVEGFNAGWQTERILIRMTEAKVEAGIWREDKTDSDEMSVEGKETISVFRFGKMSAPEAYGKCIEQLEALESSENLDVKRDVALAYVAILEQLGNAATGEQCDTLKTRIYSVTASLPVLMKHEILCSLIGTAFEAGQSRMGKAVFEDALKQVHARDLNARYDVATLSELARIWRLSGDDPDRSVSLLQDAEELLKTSSLKGTDRITAMVSLALGQGACGKEEMAWKSFSGALQIAGEMANARPRAMAVTEICNGIAQWGAPMPDVTQTELARLYEGLGDPW